MVSGDVKQRMDDIRAKDGMTLPAWLTQPILQQALECAFYTNVELATSYPEGTRAGQTDRLAISAQAIENGIVTATHKLLLSYDADRSGVLEAPELAELNRAMDRESLGDTDAVLQRLMAEQAKQKRPAKITSEDVIRAYEADIDRFLGGAMPAPYLPQDGNSR